MSITVPLHGIGHRLAAGHRLVVQLASAYWPVLWPAPEPVTLTVVPGSSTLSVPTRAAVDDSPRPMPEPERRKLKRPVTKVRDGVQTSIRRRISETGLTMLESKLDRKSSEDHLRLLENRVVQLQREEERATRKINETKRRTEQFLKARIEYQKDMQRKEEQRKARENERLNSNVRIREEKQRRQE